MTLSATTPGRTCGSCAACCTTTQVRDLNKPIDVRCDRVVPNGPPACGSCGTYGDRPRACVVFQCAWLEGYGPDDHRPDLVGVVAELMHLGADGTNPFLVALAVSPGFARHNRSVRDAVRWWRSHGLAVTVGTELIATDEQRRLLSNCEIRFADRTSIRIGGP